MTSTDEPDVDSIVSDCRMASASATFQALRDSDAWDRVTVDARTGYDAAFRNWVQSGLVINCLIRFDDTDEASVVFTTPGRHDYCTACGENESVTIGRGTPAETAQRQRTSSNCRHANLARQCGSVEPCDECGSHLYEKAVQPINHTTPGGDSIHVADCTSHQCADCEATITAF